MKKFKDYRTRAMDYDHVLYLTKEQASMLAERNLSKVILIADFGGGKLVNNLLLGSLYNQIA